MQSISAEQQVLDVLASAKGRGKDGIDAVQQIKLEAALLDLEEAVGVKDPTKRPDILDGRYLRLPIFQTMYSYDS